MKGGRVAAVTSVAAALVTASACRSEPSVRRIPIDGRPSAVTVADGVVWVTDDQRHRVHALDASSGERIRGPIPVPRNPIAIAAGRGDVWLGHAGGEVTRIATQSRRASRPIDAGESITGIAVRGNTVWAADLPTDSLIRIDARSSRVSDVTRVEDGVVRVAFSEDAAWVTNSERTVTRVEVPSGDADRPVNVGLGPIGLAFDGELVWVANSEDGTVSRIDAGSGRQAGSPVRVGLGPVAVAYGADSIWVANQDDGTVSRIDPESGRVVGEPLELGLRPRGIAFGGGAVWAVGTNPGGVVRVDLR